MKRFFKENSLSIVFLLLFILSLCGQIFNGHIVHNAELKEHGAASLDLWAYLKSGHFFSGTFENWESEFLQMGLFVWLTVFLRQKGSSESKKCDGEEKVDREPDPNKKGAPWPVKKGGIILKLYKHSLTLSLFLLFLIAFGLHFYGSLKDENLLNGLKGEALKTAGEYALSAEFWYECFQNWQSEFLSVVAIVVLSIYLREIGSSQSKPVDAPHNETGE